MSLRDTISVLREPTITLSGGTAKTFSNNNKGINGKQILVDVADTDLTTRRSITTSYTDPQLAPNINANMKLGRAELKATNPKAVDGKQYQLPMGAYLTSLPTDTVAQKHARRLDLCSMIMDAEFDNLFENGINN